MTMPAIGTVAPAFQLTALDHKVYSLGEGITTDLVLVMFFNTDCPTCQLTLPYIEKLYKTYKETGFKVWGVSQDDEAETTKFLTRHKASFPILLDDELKMTVEYEVATVPTLFLVGKGREVLQSYTGFTKDDMNALAVQVAGHYKAEAVVIADPYDGNPNWKPGCMGKWPF
ncbi:MAG: TlpA family protein disulfide reductase [Candidatus Tectomicrobia bacterium]|nr:TlpA family protein disulfide reductase [Candidatus Tectomicrobia bacterium]